MRRLWQWVREMAFWIVGGLILLSLFIAAYLDVQNKDEPAVQRPTTTTTSAPRTGSTTSTSAQPNVVVLPGEIREVVHPEVRIVEVPAATTSTTTSTTTTTTRPTTTTTTRPPLVCIVGTCS